MAHIQHVPPTPVEPVESASLDWDWGETQWANEGAFAGADYDDPDSDEGERQFYTIAFKVGRKRNVTACVDVLVVTRDLEYALEIRLPATIDETYSVELSDYDGVPAGLARVPREDSRLPDERKAQFGRILERAHDVAVETEVSG